MYTEHPWSIPCSREKMMKKLCSYNFMQLLVAMIEMWYIKYNIGFSNFYFDARRSFDATAKVFHQYILTR